MQSRDADSARGARSSGGKAGSASGQVKKPTAKTAQTQSQILASTLKTSSAQGVSSGPDTGRVEAIGEETSRPSVTASRMRSLSQQRAPQNVEQSQLQKQKLEQQISQQTSRSQQAEQSKVEQRSAQQTSQPEQLDSKTIAQQMAHQTTEQKNPEQKKLEQQSTPSTSTTQSTEKKVASKESAQQQKSATTETQQPTSRSTTASVGEPRGESSRAEQRAQHTESSRVESHMQRSTESTSTPQQKSAMTERAASSAAPATTSSGTAKSQQSTERSSTQLFSTDSTKSTKSAASVSKSTAPRQPQILRRAPGSARGTTGLPSSRSFLGLSTQEGARLRSSDATGQPGRLSDAAITRQVIYNPTIAQVNSTLQKRQVTGQMPVYNVVLDELHEAAEKEGLEPIRLSWNPSKSAERTAAQRVFAHRQRLVLSRRVQQVSESRRLGDPIRLTNTAQVPSSQTQVDVSSRVAGTAINSLLRRLYKEEDVEKLDEETAVSSLAVILRLGGEFTYEHSTRVLDLALELADEVGVRDRQTRKKIKYGAMLRDIGEFDMLLQSGDSPKTLREMGGFLEGQDMLRAGLLHDIGKINIPPEILYKPGKLTAEEYEIMKMHPIYGEEIVRPIASLRYLCPTIRGHHERWDGKGYPDGLAGEDIPIPARIIAVADVFDALSAERPYKAGMEVEKVISILNEGRGSHFDPTLVDAFMDVLGRRYPIKR